MQDQEQGLLPPQRENGRSGPAAETEAGQPAERAVETMPSMEEMLRKAELQAQQHYDAWLRAKAEADNMRKRAQADIASAHKYALESFAGELLVVRDALEAALSIETTTIEALKQGVNLTLKQLTGVFDRFSIREINPVGEKFDPHKHQAMTAVASEKAPNTVLHVFQKGYQLHDRILRPALVTVSRAAEG